MEWVSFEDDLPESGKVMLLCDAINEIISLGIYNEDTDDIEFMSIHEMTCDSNPTHWMPLPSPPKEVM